MKKGMVATSETAPPHLASVFDINSARRLPIVPQLQRSEVGWMQLAAAAPATASRRAAAKHRRDVRLPNPRWSNHLLHTAGAPPTSCCASSRGSEAARGRSHRWAAVTDIHLSLSVRVCVCERWGGAVISRSYSSLWRKGGGL